MQAPKRGLILTLAVLTIAAPAIPGLTAADASASPRTWSRDAPEVHVETAGSRSPTPLATFQASPQGGTLLDHAGSDRHWTSMAASPNGTTVEAAIVARNVSAPLHFGAALYNAEDERIGWMLLGPQLGNASSIGIREDPIQDDPEEFVRARIVFNDTHYKMCYNQGSEEFEDCLAGEIRYRSQDRLGTFKLVFWGYGTNATWRTTVSGDSNAILHAADQGQDVFLYTSEDFQGAVNRHPDRPGGDFAGHGPQLAYANIDTHLSLTVERTLFALYQPEGPGFASVTTPDGWRDCSWQLQQFEIAGCDFFEKDQVRGPGTYEFHLTDAGPGMRTPWIAGADATLPEAS